MEVDVALNAKYAIMCRKIVQIPEDVGESTHSGLQQTLSISIALFSAEQEKRLCTCVSIFVTITVSSNLFIILPIAGVVG